MKGCKVTLAMKKSSPKSKGSLKVLTQKAEKSSNLGKSPEFISWNSLKETKTKSKRPNVKQLIENAFEKCPKDDTGFLELKGFEVGVSLLGLKWSKSKCTKVFTELDSIDLGCLTLEEFQDGVLDAFKEKLATTT